MMIVIQIRTDVADSEDDHEYTTADEDANATSTSHGDDRVDGVDDN